MEAFSLDIPPRLPLFAVRAPEKRLFRLSQAIARPLSRGLLIISAHDLSMGG